MAPDLIAEFPFVESLPKREKSKLAKLWDCFQQVRAATAEHGALLPQHFAANLLDVSRQRVHQLVNEGRLESVEVAGNRFVTEKSLIEWARAEHVNGRPLNLPTTKREAWKRSWKSATEAKK